MHTRFVKPLARKTLAYLSSLALAITLSPISLIPTQAVAAPVEPAVELPASGTWGTCPWEIDVEGTLTVHPGVGADTGGKSPWSNEFDVIKKVVFVEENGQKVVAPENLASLLKDASQIESIDCAGLDTSKTINMEGMFSGCSKLVSLDVSKLDTSNVNNMTTMFQKCAALSSLDVSGFNTSQVTSMGSMFSNCSALSFLDVSSFDTSNTTSLGAMFHNCSSLTRVDVSNFDTSKVTDMGSMFFRCASLSSLDVSNFDTSNVSAMENMFYGCSSLMSLDLSNFDTSQVTTMGGMFNRCTSLSFLNISNFSDAKNPDKKPLFVSCDSLETIAVSADFSLCDNDGVINLSGELRSLSDGKTYSVEEIVNNRKGIADSYTKLDPPEIIDGSIGTEWSPVFGATISYRSNSPLYLFKEVRVDGKTLDAENYAVTEGSINVELAPKYLATLSEGRHTIDIVSHNGIASSYFSVAKAEGQKPGDSSGNGSTGDDKPPSNNDGLADKDPNQSTATETEVMYRMYNPNSGEHFYTASAAERDHLKSVGWQYEGEAWTAPKKSNTPVYRLYSGTDHHYTTSASERDYLKSVGWSDEGIGWYSDDSKTVVLFRLHNPNVNPSAPTNNSGSHHYTTSAAERDYLKSIGWNDEGTAWHGIK